MAVSFLKRGAEAHKAIKKDMKEAEISASLGGVQGFWLKEGEDRPITFLDGNLTADGLLDTSSFNQHQVKMNGKFRNHFVCVEEDEPCPLCQMGNYATLVSLFTIIDHTPYTDRNGKVHVHERKLFVAKRETMTRLQKLATRHGGLTGWTVNVNRIGDKSPEVGTDFDFLEEQDLSELAAVLKLPPEGIVPYDYSKEIKYLSADELRELGFGTAVVGQTDIAAVLGKTKKKKKVVEESDDEEDEDEGSSPFKAGKGSSMFGTSKAAKKVKKAAVPEPEEDEDEEDDEEEAPPAKAAKASSTFGKPKKASVTVKPAKGSKMLAALKKAPKEEVEEDEDDASTDEDDDGNKASAAPQSAQDVPTIRR